MSARRRAVDPVQRELFRHAVAALVDEMAVALVRTARSTHLKNSMDLSAALCDPAGRLIAQGLTLPLHLGSIPDAMRAFLARFGGELRPGDVYALNDPYNGGTHLPDIYTAQPVFRNGRVIGHVSRRDTLVAFESSRDDLRLYGVREQRPPDGSGVDSAMRIARGQK